MKQGWATCKIGDVCNLMTGGTPSKSKPEYFKNGKIKWLVSGDIHKKEIFDCKGRITEEALANSNAKYLPINSVLIALNGQGKTRGSVSILRTKATCNQSLVSMTPKNMNTIIPEFIYCNLHGRYDEIRRMTGDDGNDRRGLNMSLIKSIEIPLPPLTEQKRIVAILDEAFAAIAKAKENAEKNLQNAKELFEGYLQSIFANKSEDWEEKTLGEVCEFTQGIQKDVKLQSETQNKKQVRFLRIVDFTQGNEPPRYIDNPGEKYILNENDISVVRYGASTGFVCRGLEGALANNLFRIIPKSNKELTNEFLFVFLSSPVFQNVIKDSMNGAAMPAISFGMIKDIPFPVIPLEEQKVIVVKFEKLKTETQNLDTLYKEKLCGLDELKKSILQKAFNGELNTTKELEVL